MAEQNCVWLIFATFSQGFALIIPAKMALLLASKSKGDLGNLKEYPRHKSKKKSGVTACLGRKL
ncbi:MAG: hypothetical protein ACPH64_07790 [Porticoccaceae bacterium]